MEEKKNVLITSGTYYGRKLHTAIFYNEKGEPDTIDVFPEHMKSSVGEIYAARVSHISPQINAAFVDLGDGKRAFLPMSDHMNVIYINKHSKGDDLHQGDEIAVQIVRDPIKTKEAQASQVLTFYGSFCIMELNRRGIAASKKLSKKQRMEFKDAAVEICSELNVEEEIAYPVAVTIRTAAEGASVEEVKADIAGVFQQVLHFQKGIPYKSLFQVLRPANNPFLEKLWKIPLDQLGEIVTDHTDFLKALKESAADSDRMSGYASKVRVYEDVDYPLWKLRGVEKILKDLTRKNVWLSSGANLVLETTEALHVIDVNSGKVVSKKSAGRSMLPINKEAAKEIAKQIRLRNLSGMIIVDFINMDSEDEKKELMQYMKKSVKNDFAKVTVIDYTKLGLMEITRKKTGPSLNEKLLDSGI